MRALSDADLFRVWESGYRLHPLDRALVTLGAALPETPVQRLADWPLGRRNKALLELRCACFGSGIHGWAACPGCAEKLEFEIDARVLAGAAPQDADEPQETVVVNGRAFRLPTSRDLAGAATVTDGRSPAVHIIDGCRIQADENAVWSEDEIAEIEERMASADPLAEIRLKLDCPACSLQWEESLDIGSFIWEEIEARARRLVLAVHTLASAYGWTEAEILSLSENRRALYLEMAQS
jgi:hypothetical protein